jgi:PhzF family phenazine biosynthesis protein
MKLIVYQVDSFTTRIFEGNPAGVVLNADTLDEEQMLRIAREMNDSETAFIIDRGGDGYDIEVRFFTPTREVPICGHATIAAITCTPGKGDRTGNHRPENRGGKSSDGDCR